MLHTYETYSIDPMPTPPIFNRSGREWPNLTPDEALYLDFAIQHPCANLPIYSVPIYGEYFKAKNERANWCYFIGPLKIYDQICDYLAETVTINFVETLPIDSMKDKNYCVGIWSGKLGPALNSETLAKLTTAAHYSENVSMMANYPTFNKT